MKKYLFILPAFLGLLLASCSETDETDAEYDNWQARNDMFFEGIYKQAKDSIEAGSKNWKIIKDLAKDDSASTDIKQFIVVKVLNEGEGTECPMQTDSVRVHYKGYLMSTDYTSSAQTATEYTYGKAFDSSWTGPYNTATTVPTSFKVNTVVSGFSTAIQYMHVKDRWLVYIPYNLGYGSTAQTSIPAYSTLMFDLTLQAFARPGTTMPTFE